MKILLCTLLVIVIHSTLIPIHPQTQRCTFIYSQKQDDTIKLSIKFPNHLQIQQSYDYIVELQDIDGNVLNTQKIHNRTYKNQLIVPYGAIQQVCMKIQSKQNINGSISSFTSELLVQYQANIHFITTEFKMPEIIKGIAEDEVNQLKKQAENILNLTKRFIQIQNQQKVQQNIQFNEKTEIQSQFYGWVVFQLLVIIIIGCYQWIKIKTKIQSKRDQ